MSEDTTTNGGSTQPRRVQRLQAAAGEPITPPTTVKPVAGFNYSPVAPEGRPPVARHPRRRKALLIMACVVALGFGAAVPVAIASRKAVTKNTSGGAPALKKEAVDPTTLKGEGDGRINILLLGIGGAGHDGGNLSDTIMVASIDPRTKDVAMISIPRDMYVKIGDYGSSKINAAYAYGEMYDYEGGGLALAKSTVSKVLNVPIHYGIRVDFAAFRQAVDSVGGVDVNVPKALYDPLYPLGETGKYMVVNVPAGQQHFNGEQALQYTRSRETTSDFDRAARQQQVILALKEKATGLKTLSNPAAMLGLVTAAGTHVQTDFQPNELTKLASIVKDIDTTKVSSKVLDTTNYLDQTTDQRGYIEYPKLGLYNYSDIQDFVHGLFADSYLKQENAAVLVQNGTPKNGVALQVFKLLKGYGYNLMPAATADRSDYATTQIIDYSNGTKPYTIKYLEKRFATKAVKQAKTATTVDPATGQPAAQPDVTVILGANYTPQEVQQ